MIINIDPVDIASPLPILSISNFSTTYRTFHISTKDANALFGLQRGDFATDAICIGPNNTCIIVNGGVCAYWDNSMELPEIVKDYPVLSVLEYEDGFILIHFDHLSTVSLGKIRTGARIVDDDLQVIKYENGVLVYKGLINGEQCAPRAIKLEGYFSS